MEAFLLSHVRPAACQGWVVSPVTLPSLHSQGVSTVVIGNAYTNAQRAAALHAVATGRAQALLSTEMAARGLDLPRLRCVRV